MSINNIPIRPLSWIRKLLIKPDWQRRPLKIPLGLYKGLKIFITFSYDSQLYLGLWEVETALYIKKAARMCAWAVDVGARAGEMCVYLLKNSAADKIFGFDPLPDNFRENLILNNEENSKRIIISTNFIGTSDGGHVTKLDAMGIDYEKPGFVKVDVDGAELDVLKSGDLLFTRGKDIVLLIETHSEQMEKDCIAWLEERGYFCKVIYNAWWRIFIPESRPIPHNRWFWAEKQPHYA